MVREHIKIAYFASGLIGRKASGTAQTARKILEHMILNENRKFEITLILKNQHERNEILNDSVLYRCNLVVLPKVRGGFLKSSRQYYKYSWLMDKNVFDILFFSVPRIYPFFWKFPAKHFVCIFHAAADITVPTKNFILSRVLYNVILKIQWRYLDLIFADSDFAVREIHENYKIPTDKITKIYLGTDNLWLKSIDPLPGLNFENNTLLVVGRWQKYKNIHSILQAIKISEIPQIKACNVIVLGKKVDSEIELFNEIIKDFPVNRLQIIEYVSDSQLKFLFSKVDVVIHPSVNEGFGIPPFEAFGEGAILIVHEGTPASDYLKHFDGVLIEDLNDLGKVEKVILQALSLKRQDIKQRRSYLAEMEMTWDYVGKNYAKILSSLVH